MTTFEITISGVAAVLFLSQAWMIAEFTGMKNEIRERTGINNDTLKLRLQAYERLTLLAERISLKNLISSLPNAGITSREMQGAIIEAIKAEYDYNLSQQVYVTPEAWRAVSNLKEQNIYIVNQLSTTLPPQATAMDLNKRIIDYLMTDEKASLHNIVIEALIFEAKKLM